MSPFVSVSVGYKLNSVRKSQLGIVHNTFVRSRSGWNSSTSAAGVQAGVDGIPRCERLSEQMSA